MNFEKILILVCTVIIVGLLAINEKPSNPPHRHVEVNRYYARGVKIVPVIMCRTDSAQVIFGTDHKVTELSIEYFSR